MPVELAVTRCHHHTALEYGVSKPHYMNLKLTMSLFLPTGYRAVEVPDKKRENQRAKVRGKNSDPLTLRHWMFEWK